MNVGEIKTYDVANGTGIRVTVFCLRVYEPLQRLFPAADLGF